MITIHTPHMESANGTARGNVEAREDGGRLIHEDVFDLTSARSRKQFAKAVASLSNSPESVAVVEQALLARLEELRKLTVELPADPLPAAKPGKAKWAPSPETIIDFPEPLKLARHLLAAHYVDTDRRLLLRRFRGEWWAFDRCGYSMVDVEAIRARIYRHLEKLWVPVRDKEGEPTGEYRKIQPRTSDVREVDNAMVACDTLASGNMPQWLDGRKSPAPADVVAFENGLIDTASYRSGSAGLLPPTPHWFSGVCCPYSFDPAATCPLWLKTLGEIFNDDAECIALVQEWFGYQLVPDNRHEKMMLLVGRSRSGKGTILEAMTAMLGADQVASTSFTKLASRFGLAPLLGRLSAILPDAHIGRSVDAVAALEVIKSITGNDAQAIDQKNIKELPLVHLPVRFTAAVNELPRLPDTAGALKPRLLLLYHPNSFAGREDRGLKARLHAEAPGIAAWALEGLFRLREQGTFTEPAASAQILEEFERTVSPVKGFLHERCEIDPTFWIEKIQLYNGWCQWCKERGDEPGNTSQFGQQLIAAEPTIQSAKRGPKGQQFPVYVGVKPC